MAPPLKRFPLSRLNVDPSRFQYKVETEASGATGTFDRTAKWDAEMNKERPFAVWRDPADGKIYVIDGHNRYQLAKRAGVKNVAVQFIKADSAEAARDVGARTNIAKGRGSAKDTAAFRASRPGASKGGRRRREKTPSTTSPTRLRKSGKVQQ